MQSRGSIRLRGHISSRGGNRDGQWRGHYGSLRQDHKPAKFLSQAIADRWKSYRKRLKICQKNFTEVSVHDLRISLRKLIAILDILRMFHITSKLDQARRQLNKQLKRLSQLRDLHIQIKYLPTLRSTGPAAQAYCDLLVERESLVAKDLQRRIKRIRVPHRLSRSAKLLLKFPAKRHPTSLQRIQSIYEKAFKFAFAGVMRRKRKINPSRPPTIHRLRVALKKFRYLLETLQPAMTGISKSQIKEMQKFQVMMGNIQDIYILITGIQSDASRLTPTVKRSLPPLIRELRRRLSANIALFLPVVDKITSYSP